MKRPCARFHQTTRISLLTQKTELRAVKWEQWSSFSVSNVTVHFSQSFCLQNCSASVICKIKCRHKCSLFHPIQADAGRKASKGVSWPQCSLHTRGDGCVRNTTSEGQRFRSLLAVWWLLKERIRKGNSIRNPQFCCSAQHC